MTTIKKRIGLVCISLALSSPIYAQYARGHNLLLDAWIGLIGAVFCYLFFRIWDWIKKKIYEFFHQKEKEVKDCTKPEEKPVIDKHEALSIMKEKKFDLDKHDAIYTNNVNQLFCPYCGKEIEEVSFPEKS